MDDLQLAVAHYALVFPDLASLGEAPSFQAWRTEYDRVSATGLSPTLATATSDDGGSVSASRNFDQLTLMRALHMRRNQLDATYVTPFEPLPAIAGRRLGIAIRLGC